MRVCRAILFVLAAAASFSQGASGVALARPPASERPDILLVVSDDQGWGDFGFMGHETIRTPHLDSLAATSAVFAHGYVPTSLCRASLATLLTGRYAHEHRICCNDPPEGVARAAMHPFLRDAPTIPRLLADRGYRSFQTGKFWEGHYSNGGFTHGMTLDRPPRGRHGDDGLVIGRETMQPIYDFLAEGGAEPFFIWYAPMMPHEPHNPPARLLDRYAANGRNPRLARYWAMCEWFDETCGALFDHLKRIGRWENTLVIFVIDNGWIQETAPANEVRKGAAPKSKLSPYDGGVRTPVLVHWPGRVEPGLRRDLVSTIDIAPTVLRAAGLSPPADMRGLDLMTSAGGRANLARSAVFGEIFVHTARALTPPGVNLTHRWVRRGEWKLIVAQEKPDAPELYHIGRDPHEADNRAAAEPREVAALRHLLDEWWDGR